MFETSGATAIAVWAERAKSGKKLRREMQEKTRRCNDPKNNEKKTRKNE